MFVEVPSCLSSSLLLALGGARYREMKGRVDVSVSVRRTDACGHQRVISLALAGAANAQPSAAGTLRHPEFGHVIDVLASRGLILDAAAAGTLSHAGAGAASHLHPPTSEGSP